MIGMARAVEHSRPLRQRHWSTPTPSDTAGSRRPTPGASCSSRRAGWVGFDPTNNCLVGGNFIKVAVGRDFRDVPPNKGLYRGKAKETIDVDVHSEELNEIPPELAAERVESLNVPTFPTGVVIHRDMINQQQEQQQQ